VNPTASSRLAKKEREVLVDDQDEGLGALEIRGLRKTYPGFALSVGRLVVPPGSALAIVGGNGSGKTVLLRCVVGTTMAQEGVVIVGSRSYAAGDRSRASLISYAGADSRFVEDVDGASHLRLGRALVHGWDARTADRLVEALHLELAKPVKALSRGNRAKLSLICALARPSRYLVLDEVMPPLDAGARQVVYRELLTRKEGGSGLLFATHDDADVDMLADEVLTLRSGEVVSLDPRRCAACLDAPAAFRGASAVAGAG
jgi:ABC-2 type transport system ATP-binding protein